MFSRSFARAARSARFATRSYSSAPSAAPKRSDLPWAVASLAIFGPTVFYLTSPPSDSHSHGHGDAVHDTAKKVVAKAKAVVEPEEEEEAAEEPAPKEEEESAPAPEEPKEEKKEAAAAPAATSHSAEDTLPDDAHDLKTASADGPKEVGKAGAASQQAEESSKSEEKEEKNE